MCILAQLFSCTGCGQACLEAALDPHRPRQCWSHAHLRADWWSLTQPCFREDSLCWYRTNPALAPHSIVNRFVLSDSSWFVQGSKLSAGRFCHGDEPTIADCCLVPQVGKTIHRLNLRKHIWGEHPCSSWSPWECKYKSKSDNFIFNLPIAEDHIYLQVYNAVNMYKLSTSQYPNISKIYQEATQHPAFEKAWPDRQEDFGKPAWGLYASQRKWHVKLNPPGDTQCTFT